MRFPLLLLSLLAAGAASGRADYTVAHRYPIGGDASRWDYLVIDPATRYLYVAHFTKFEVLNADTGRRVGEIGPASRAHGVAIVPALHRGFATSGNDATVIVFDTRTLKTIARLKSPGKNPDAVQYDADTRKVYAVNGASGTVAVIDPVDLRVTGTVTLAEDGKLEQIGFDGRGHAFVNNEEKSCMYVFDTHTLQRLGTWSLAPAEGGTGLAVDAVHHRAFAACDGKLAVVDTDTGRVVATPAIGPDPDGVAFDPATGRIFTSNADATMTVLHEDAPDEYRLLETVPTGTGAKQLAVDAKTGRVFVPTGKFQASADKLPPVVPGTFEILALQP